MPDENRPSAAKTPENQRPEPQSPAYELWLPAQQTVPVIFSSPHSGRDYPANFLARSQLDSQQIRSSEDAFVDQLFARAPAHGAPLICARAPRAFIDLNRGADELDPAVIEGIRQSTHNPRISSGLGVIPRVVSGGRSIYSGKLSQSEAQSRIETWWQPYHSALHRLTESTLSTFGRALLIDCHSMPHEAIATHCRHRDAQPQVVLGDRFGAAAHIQMTELVEAAFCEAGFRVSRNAPFAGAYITQAYGRPSRGLHVIQIEIDRCLYMDETRIEPLPHFPQFCQMMNGIISKICAGFSQGRKSLAAE